ncbi:MAG: serine protease [Bacteroidia bacterium]|nr:serine protease [Bacteroidia bacterium]
MSRILPAVLLLSCAGLARAQETLRAPVALLRSGGESGAAFIVGERGGQLYLLTAAHVIADADARDIRLSFRGSHSAAAQVVNSDLETDIAAIRCPLPPGMAAPASYAPPSGALVFDLPVRVVGHPLGEDWDIVSGTVKDPAGLGGRFSITPAGIDRGCSGGPVLSSRYELLGMVQQDGPQKAWCRSYATLMEACRLWGVPVTLLTGIPEDSPPEDPVQTECAQQRQIGATAYQARRWEQARAAYQRANERCPDAALQQRIRECEAELGKDREYRRLRDLGLAAPDLSTALGYYRQAQQQRSTAEIQNLISSTKSLVELKKVAEEPEISQFNFHGPIAGTALDFRQPPMFEQLNQIASGYNLAHGINPDDVSALSISKRPPIAFYAGWRSVFPIGERNSISGLLVYGFSTRAFSDSATFTKGGAMYSNAWEGVYRQHMVMAELGTSILKRHCFLASSWALHIRQGQVEGSSYFGSLQVATDPIADKPFGISGLYTGHNAILHTGLAITPRYRLVYFPIRVMVPIVSFGDPYLARLSSLTGSSGYLPSSWDAVSSGDEFLDFSEYLSLIGERAWFSIGIEIVLNVAKKIRK